MIIILHVIQIIFQFPCPGGVPESPESFCFNLPDPFPCDFKDIPNFFKSMRISVIKTKPHTNYFLFPGIFHKHSNPDIKIRFSILSLSHGCNSSSDFGNSSFVLPYYSPSLSFDNNATASSTFKTFP